MAPTWEAIMKNIFATGVASACMCAASAAAAMELTSVDMTNNGPIAKEQVYPECGGANISPALAWSGAPAGTKSFALTDNDPDGGPGGWVHWIVVSIPASATGFPKNGMTAGAVAMKNDFGDAKYDGPCPPAGSDVHHYHFTLYALPEPLPFDAAVKPADVIPMLSKAALDKAELVGTYEISR